MRVYTTSALYTYLELIFRTRKLFIISMAVCTMAMLAVVLMKPKSYTATAILQLYDDGVNGGGNSDEEQRSKVGSIQAKVNLLSIHLKDREFFKKAFEAAGLDKDRTEAELDKMIKDAQSNINFSSNNMSFLEITCKSPTQFCVPVLSAVIAQYSNAVFGASTKRQVAYLSQMGSIVALYTDQAKKAEEKLHKFEDGFIKQGTPDPTSILQEINGFKAQVTALQTQMDAYQAEINTYTTNLETTPKELELDSTTEEIPVTETAEYKVLLSEQGRLTETLAKLSATYTDDNIKVVDAKNQLEKLNTQLKALTDAKTGPKRGKTTRRKQLNPQYTQLQSYLVSSQNHYAMSAAQLKGVIKQLDTARSKIYLIPQYRSQYGELSTRHAQYRTLRDNLDNEYQRMRVQYDTDFERIKQGIRLVVAPTAELDTTGKKQAILLIAGPVLGLVIAFAFSLLTETLDHSIRTPSDVERYLSKPVLAVLPNMRPAKKVTELIRIAVKGDWKDAPPALPPGGRVSRRDT